jgi:hypothetical protein
MASLSPRLPCPLPAPSAGAPPKMSSSRCSTPSRAKGKTPLKVRTLATMRHASFCQRSDRDGYKVGDFKTAMQSLFSKGAIKVAEYGPPSNPKRKLMRE